MVAAICADGDALNPLIVIHRQTVDQELRTLGYTNANLTLAHSSTGYVNAKIFQRWISDIYIPHLRGKRSRTGYDGPSVLIMDGCSSHDVDLIREKLEDENAFVFALPAHSSDQLQFLDVGIFATLKLRYAQQSTDANLSATTRQIVKVCDAWRQATTPRNVVAAFRRGGVSVYWDEQKAMNYAYVDRRYADKVRHFQQTEEFLVTTKRRRTNL